MIMKMYGNRQVSGMAILLVWIGGCGGSHETLLPASGFVTLDGDPLPEATVAFIPVKSNQQQPSYGYTDDDGKYVLKTPEGYVGVSPGEYRIVVSRMVMEDGSPIPPGSQTGAAEGHESIPFPHCDPRATKHVAVVSDGTQEFDVEITSQPETKKRKT